MAKRLILRLLLLLLSGITRAIEKPGTLKQASSKGFRLIADYIFGNYTSRSVSGGNQEVSMTAHVTIQ